METFVLTVWEMHPCDIAKVVIERFLKNEISLFRNPLVPELEMIIGNCIVK
jgi:hypothetical protein